MGVAAPREDRDDGDGWEDAEPDEEAVQVVGFFDDKVFASAKQMLDDCRERYNFDFLSVQKQHSQSGPAISDLV